MTLKTSTHQFCKRIHIRFVWMLSIVLLTFNLTVAQHHDHSDQTDGINHVMACRSGVNFIDNLPVPQLMAGIGSSSLKINTNSPLAQQYFNQGVAQLHCFWDLEAFRSFKEAVQLDSTAIMSYWGLLHTILFIDNKEFDDDKEMAISKLNALVDDAEGYEALLEKPVKVTTQDRSKLTRAAG